MQNIRTTIRIMLLFLLEELSNILYKSFNCVYSYYYYYEIRKLKYGETLLKVLIIDNIKFI